MTPAREEDDMTRKLDRRQALTAFGSVGLGALLAACGGDSGTGGAATAVPTTDGGTATVEPQASTSPSTADRFGDASSCTLTPELTEGPYYFDADAIRSDIREDREGAPLRLAIRVRDAQSCEPIANAVVDIWHCDAGGLYSGFEAASQGGPGGGRSDEERYLRGAQVTNADGIVEFLTVYPGWYRGRTTHIHTKVHLDRTTLLTTQLFFDEEVTAAVYEADPYAANRGRDVFNDGDGIFSEELVLDLSREGEEHVGVISFDVASA
jgi:protocatechuate 3,4-dioxygenase beta subunit